MSGRRSREWRAHEQRLLAIHAAAPALRPALDTLDEVLRVLRSEVRALVAPDIVSPRLGPGAGGYGEAVEVAWHGPGWSVDLRVSRWTCEYLCGVAGHGPVAGLWAVWSRPVHPELVEEARRAAGLCGRSPMPRPGEHCDEGEEVCGG